jgi:hypothetical protein
MMAVRLPLERSRPTGYTAGRPKVLMTNSPIAKTEADNRLQALAKLRLLVAYLGESDQYDWWRTSFLSPTGRRYLEFNFPRTVLSAGINSVSHAAKELHDRRIGRNGVFHLFRLPHGIEQDLHFLLAGDFKDELDELINGRDHALKALGELAEGEKLQSEGPTRISAIGQMTHRPSLRRLAACYLWAFESGKQTFPYFTGE